MKLLMPLLVSALVTLMGQLGVHAQTFSYGGDGSSANATTGENFYTVTSGTNAGGDPFSETLSGNFIPQSFVVQSGTLTLLESNSGQGAFVGQLGHNNGTVDIQGGTFNFSATGASAGQFVIGNYGNTGSVTQEGGTFNLTLTNGLVLGRQDGVGTYTLSGGTLALLNTDVIQFNINAGGGPDGTPAPAGSDYINFTLGSTGEISLYNGGTAGSTLSTFDNYVAANEILYGGADATSTDFTETTVGNQDIYAVTTPEPSTYALLVGGVMVLLAWQRRSRLASRC